MSNAMRERLIKEIQRVDKKTKTVETMSEKSFFKWLAKALKKQSAGIKLK